MGILGAVDPAIGALPLSSLALPLLDAAPDGMFLTNVAGIIVLVNKQLEALFGFTRDELVGTAVERLLPDRFQRGHTAHRQAYHHNPQPRAMGSGLDLWARRSDGSEFPVEISLSPVTANDEIFYFASVRDVTDRVEALERTEAWMAALTDARRALLDGEVPVTTLANISDQARRLTGADHSWVTHDAVGFARTDDARRLELPLGPGFGSETSTLILSRDDASASFAPHTIAAATNFVEQVVLAVEASQSRQHQARLNILEDRDRIARDLHDLVIQRLFAAGLGLQSLAARTEARPISDRLEATVTELDNIIRELRSTIFGLGQVDRVRSIRQQITDAALSHTDALGFSPRVTLHGDVDELPLAIVEQLLPSLHEALSNVVRHAAASSTTVTVDLRTNQAILEVLDDGVGITDDGIRGNGLTNLVNRARRIGGDCVVERRSNGEGTAVVWTAPR